MHLVYLSGICGDWKIGKNGGFQIDFINVKLLKNMLKNIIKKFIYGFEVNNHKVIILEIVLRLFFKIEEVNW